MHPFKKIVLFSLFAAQCLFSQKENQTTALEKTVTKQYEISYKKSNFDVYPLDKNGLVLFFKFGNDTDNFLDCIKLTTENLQQYKTMDLVYYASLAEANIKSQFTIVESRLVKNDARPTYHLLVYEKMMGDNWVKIHQRIYFNNGFGFSLSLRTVKSKFDKLLLDSAEIFNSFKIVN